MRLSDFYITEEYKTKITDVESVVNGIRSNATRALKLAQSGNYLFKGFNGHQNYYLLNPTLEDHGAQNTENIHYNVIRSLSEWEHIADRLRCVDMSNSYEYARQYGRVYVCFPNDDAIVSHISERDFFYITNPTISELNRDLIKYLHMIHGSPKLYGRTPEENAQDLETLDHIVYDHATPDETMGFLKMTSGLDRMTRTHITDYIEKLRKAAGKVYNDLSHLDFDMAREIWAEGKVYAVALDDLDMLVKLGISEDIYKDIG